MLKHTPLILLHFMLFLLSLCKTTQGCGGKWTPQKVSSAVTSSPINTCEYSGNENNNSTGTPADIRNDTQYLRLVSYGLTDSALNMTLISDQVTELFGLDLESNKLTKVPDVHYFQTTLQYLNLDKNDVKVLDLNSFSGMIFLHTLSLSTNQINSSSFVPLNVNQSLSLKHWYLDNNMLTYISLDSLLNLGNFERINVTNNSLNYIHPLSNSNYNSLSIKKIELEYNKFTEIDFNWFAGISNIAHVLLQGNPATKFTMPGLKNIVTIKNLYLQNYTFQNHVMFENISDLKILDMTNCTFPNGILDLNGYTHLTNLQSLKIPKSNISSILPLEPGIILPSLNTIVFDRHGNWSSCFNLTHFRKDIMPSLGSISLNYVSNIEFCGQSDQVYLLNIGETQKSGSFNLSHCLTQFPALRQISLNSNYLTSLHVTPGQVTNMYSISLYNNKFTELDLGFYARIAPNLRYLTMARNLITQVSLKLNPGESLKSLFRIDLNANPFVTVTGPFCEPYFNSLSTGLELRLNSAKLQCNRCLMWLKTCPYKLHFGTSQPVCSGPEKFAGQKVTAVTAIQMSEVQCENDDDSTHWFTKSGSDKNSTAILLSSFSYRGEQDCGRTAVSLNGASFTYNHDNKLCVVYMDDSGEYNSVN